MQAQPADPAPGNGSPLVRLSACHAHIERRCMGLRRLAVYWAARGADARARAVAAGMLRFFDTMVLSHHADEEQDLFPALIEAMAGSDAVCLREMVAGLTTDHRQIEAFWRRVRAALEQLAEGWPTALASADVEALANAVRQHTEREERELLPMAARLMGDDALAHIGRAMHERRGLDSAA
jgi:iron-sulfur cluster repair protein YtfE (RIC family)